ncbi:MAG: anaerobic sulfatase maturase [Rhodoferax sp.]
MHLMAKPIGPLCNLDCSYCFYLEKEAFFPARERFRMGEAVLDAYVRRYIEAQPTPVVEFTWQGGEPTLLGVDFFRQVVQLQRRYANGKTIRNTLQTNATLIDGAWAQFLAAEGFLVGVSLDGPAHLHSLHRHDKRGRSSFDSTLQGLQRLLAVGVECNVLVTVSREVSQQPLVVYDFLKELGVRYIQFNPVVERVPDAQEKTIGLHFSKPPQWSCAGPAAPLGAKASAPPRVSAQSVEPVAYGDFLIAIYDQWVRHDVGAVHVLNFDWALASWCQVPSGVCLFSPRCGKAAIVEHDGSVYACDHFMYPEYRLGNLLRDDVSAMMQSPRQQRFGADKEERLPAMCRSCTYRFACHGECPKNRFVATPDGEPGLNYLCPGYLKYFRHITQSMNAMARLVAHGQPASLVMQAFGGPLIVPLAPPSSNRQP